MANSSQFLPFSLPSIGSEETQEVVDTLQSSWLTSGPKTKQFETEFAAYVTSKHALAVNSCTAGLHLALRCLNLSPGDEIITTPLTFCATVNCIIEAGGTPVLADVGADLNLDPDRVSAFITPRTKGILPVHFAGLPCAMDRLWDIARKNKLSVIEDAAHAVGSTYRGVPIGSGESAAVAFSFYATKNLCTGEGGMVTTSSEALADRMRILCLHGISRDAWNRYSEKGSWYYEVVECGHKYNMSDLMAAIGIHQLRKLEAMNERRAAIASQYNAAFGEMSELQIPPDRQDSRHSWHLYALRLNLDRLTLDRAQFFEEMRTRGIGCSVHFIPIPLHPYYRDNLELRDPCKLALSEYPRLLSLPIYAKMTDDDVARVVQAVRDIVQRHRKEVPVFSNT
jgi:dTDP-4-amino-4,6-dideoxygalactose transaminase